MSAKPLDEEALFHAARRIESSEERAKFIDQAAAGDRGLVERVRALLDMHESEPESFSPPPSPTADYQPPAERPGAKIGPYILREQIGEGGFGLVFVAEQQEPVRRKVALKLIKPGMDTRQVIARFEQERQALALMDHPNIARVLDAGAADSGRPFFVMELVRGIPITDYCDQHHLSPRDRLDLFVAVCQAVQHAHQKGVIHRDLKPSNVLVTSHDGKPVPKIIDFGVAKAINQHLTERTIYTQFAQLIGTPLYMSPEQAEMSGLDIDTRSDVYSLGVLLYELLTGTTPLEKQRFAKAAYDEIRKIIREEEPPKPSTRLSTSASLPSVAASRNTEPAKLSKLVRGDLDWITMKCLEKDRTRRYETANALARDLQRYLSDEPIEARPPSTTYRVQKFARKHKAGLAAASTIALLLIAGVAVSAWQAIRATRAEHLALQQQKLALAESDAKEQALAAEADQRRRAEANEQQAKQREAETAAVLQFVRDKVFAAARPEGQDGGLGRDVPLRKAIEASLPWVEAGFRDQPLVEARLRKTLGISFDLLGDAEQARRQFQRALDLYRTSLGPDHPDTWTSMSNLAACLTDLGQYDAALALHREVLTRRQQKLGPHHPDTLASMVNFATVLRSMGRLPEALALGEQTHSLLKEHLGPDHWYTQANMANLAVSYFDAGRYPDALKLQQELLSAMRAKFGADHPQTLTEMNNVSVTLRALHRHPESLKLCEEVLALRVAKFGRDHPDTLDSMDNLGVELCAAGRAAEGRMLLEETLATRRKKFSSDHPATLRCMSNLAYACRCLGRYAENLEILHEALALQSAKLGEDHPHALETLAAVANALAALGQDASARATFEKLVSLRTRKLGPDHPDTLNALNDLAWLLAVSADSKVRDARRPLELSTRLVQKAPTNTYYRGTLGVARYRTDDWKGATIDLEESIRLRGADDSSNAGAGFFLAMAYAKLNDKTKARAWFDKSVAWMNKIPAPQIDPELRRFHTEAAALLGVPKASPRSPSP